MTRLLTKPILEICDISKYLTALDMTWRCDTSRTDEVGTLALNLNTIFFDWNGDGISNHVGIVEKCENGRVYTVEGNSGDAVRQEIYMKDSKVILEYGVLAGARK